MIKAIIFDWGGVLINSPGDELMNYCAKELGVEVNLLKNAFAKYKASFQKGTIAEDDIWDNVCKELGVQKPTTKSLWKDAVTQIFTDKQEVYNLINSLKKQGYIIGFLSNTETPAMEYFFEQGYDTYFDSITFSCAEHIVKPEESIYRLALQKLDIEADEVIFIDDKLHFVEAAAKLGIHGIVFNGYDILVQDLEGYSIVV